MSLALMYYLMSVLGNLVALCILLNIACAGTFVCFWIIQYAEDTNDDLRPIAAKIWKKSLVILVFSLLFTVMIPSKKDMAIMAGLHIGQKGVEYAVDATSEYMPQIKQIISKELNDIIKKQE